MKIKLTKEFITRLQDAFALTDFKTLSDREKRIFLVAEPFKALLYSLSTNDGLYARINASKTVEVIEPGNAVLTMRLCKYLSFYEKEFPKEIILAIESDSTAVFVNGKKEVSLNNLSADDYHATFTSWESKINGSEPIATLELYEVFSKALQFCSVIETATPALTGVCFIGNGDKISISSTDGRRLFHQTMTAESPNFTKVVPGSGLRKILRFLKAKTTIYINDGDVFFHVDDYIFKLVSLTGRYPELDPIIYGTRGERNAFVAKNALIESITKVATVLSDPNYGRVTLSFQDNVLTVSATDSTFGQATKNISCRYNKPPISISFAVEYLLSVIRVCESETLELLFNENTPVHILDKDLTTVVMPVV